MAVPDLPPGFDFTDPDLYASRVPSEEFAELRRTQPVWWNAQRRGSAGFDDEGYWAVTKHADIIDVSKRSEVFSSWENTALIRFDESIERDAIEMQRVILLNMDPPQQTKVRAIVSRGFTPRSIMNMRGNLQARAERIVATALAEGTGDFVADVACELPLQAIAELIGVPQEDRKKIFEWSNQMIGYDDPEFSDAGTMAAMELLTYAMEMAENRKVEPRDDIITKLVNASIDGEELSSDEFGYFVLMLAVAGNETTRNAISHGMQAFFDHPDQWELFKSQRPESAADEIIRWGTPVTVFQRTATADTELGGQQIQQGDRVRAVLPFRQLRRGRVRPPGAVRHPPRPQPAPRPRRLRRALLPGRQPGQARDRADLQRDRRRDAGHPLGGRPRTAPVRLAQRHQAPPGQLPLTQPVFADSFQSYFSSSSNK